MPYVERDSSGRIVAVRLQPDARATEPLASDDPQILAFLGLPAAPAAAAAAAGVPAEPFDVLDADFVRVIEDVIDVLIGRHVINLTDLPPEAQAKLMQRKGLRDQMGRASLQLFGDPQDRGVI